MKKQNLLKSMLCLLLGLVCNVAWADQLVANGVYTIQGGTAAQHRGYIAAGEGYTDYPVLSDIGWSTYSGNSTEAIENGKCWYITFNSTESKYYIYNIALNRFLVVENNQVNFGDTPYLWEIVENEQSNVTYQSIKYVSAACGGKPRNINYHWQANDGGSMHTLTLVDNGTQTFAAQIAAANKVINGETTELTYTLTDEAANVFTGSYAGVELITEPTFTGVAGYTLSNKAWDGANFTATITFPFPVSSSTVTNPTMIANGASWSNPNTRKWHAVTVDGTDYVKVQTAQVQASSANEWLWAICPELDENEKFTFKIKSISKGAYVTASTVATGNANDVQGNTKPVSLSTEGTAFTYDLRSGSNYQFSYTNSNSVSLHLSMNGSGDTDVFLGVYSGSHSGNDVCFPIPIENTNFGFPISTENNEEEVFICPFSDTAIKYYVSGTDVKATKTAPTNETIENYVWAIYPALNETSFTFTIKNIATKKYIHTTSTSDQHAQGVVVVSETATEFTLETNNQFKSSTGKFLSTNTNTVDDQFAGTWSSSHNGTKNSIASALGENTYSLTDAAGNVYTGTYNGYVGISEPTFTGLEYTFINKSWSGNQFTADIEFNNLPFPISKLGEEDWTFIRTEAMSEGICYFYTNGDKIVTKSTHGDNGKGYLPTADGDEIKKWQWAIYPTLADGAFTFRIKNRAADKFVGSSDVTLVESGAQFRWVACVGNGYGFRAVDNDKFFSANSSAAGEKDAILWSKTGTSHKGANLLFPETSYTITTGASGYTALYTSVPTNAGVAVYSGKLNDDNTQLSLARIIGTIPANTGVILKGEASTTYILAEAEDDVDPIQENDLTGSSESVIVSAVEGVPYTLHATEATDDAESVATFQKCTEETIAGGQAYLVLPAGIEDRIITLQLPTEVTYIVDKLNGNLYRDEALNQNWNHAWKSDGEPQFQLISGGYNMCWAGNNVELMTGPSGSCTYTLTAPTGYVITEYSFTFANNNHEVGIELLMDDGMAYMTSTQAKTISAEDLTTNTVSFTLKGSNGSGVVLTDFVVTIDKDVIEAPKMSTAEEQHWYYITSAATNESTSYCAGKVIYYDSEAQKLRFGDKTFNASYVWSFWEDQEGKIAIKNYNNEYFGTAGSGTGGSTAFGVVDEANYIYNISEAHGFFTIDDGGVALHAQQANSVIVRWAAAEGNASLWRFNEVNMANVSAEVRATRVQQGKVTTGIGNTDQPIIRSVIRVTGLEGNVTFQGVTGKFAGDNKADVAKVKAYFATDERELFVDPEQKMTWRNTNGVQFGNEVTIAEDGTFTITGEKTLEVGEYYLWIAYDIAETATEGNHVDASITSYTIDGAEVAESNGDPQHSVTIFLSEGAVLMPMDKGSLYYRIPAITTVTKDGKPRLVTLTDDRKQHNSDLPSHCYLVAQYSDDYGKTWSDPLTVAGTETTGGDYGHGDASIVTDRNTGNIIGIMTSCGTYGHGFFGGTAEQPPLWKTIISRDGGETWETPVDHTASLFGAACDNEKTQTWKSGFSGSGAALQKRDGTLVSSFVNRQADNSQHFYFFMSKDGGENWYVSGTSGTAAADEPKTLERNNGDLAISVRASGYNYYNYTSDNGATWHNASRTRFDTGISGNACDGEYMVWCSTVEGNFMDIAFQTLPYSGSRENVSIALSLDEGATFLTPKTICPIGSAYSAAVVLPDGTLGVYYEEDGIYGGYTMRFVRFSLDWASDGAYKFPDDNPYKPIAAVEPQTVTSSIGEYKIGTFYANDPVEIPDGVKAYAAIEEPVMEDGVGVITMTEVEDIIPAHTGVLLRADTDDYTFVQASTNGAFVNGNMMRGYAGAAEYKEVTLPDVNSYTTYVLTVKNDAAGFYKKTAGFKVYNNKAYLQVPVEAVTSAAGLRIRFGADEETTGIQMTTDNGQQTTVIYDLQGRRVEKMEKGVYIVNGKKVIR